ncbi:hypothetical protein K9N08_01305 [Candidatus Gracilibacteria bacterium]|nr:hypothetical protein [Candidatus Gracilibacteria bacterium]MCF7856178.1 hypothetical protein [Candidatus Gracilibacteria bacterium]MCF7896450.1 hypothetical protein [Candidatus Gracilibacteria bacterium]
MKQIKKTFRDFEKISAREQRLIFADKNSGGEQKGGEDSAEDETKSDLDWKDFPNLRTFEMELEKHVRDGKMSEAEKERLKKQASREKKAGEGKEKIVEEQKAVVLIENANLDEIDQRLVAGIDKKYISSLKELREAIRNEIFDLGIKKETSKTEAVKKEIEKFEHETVKRIKDILAQTRKHRQIFDEIEAEERLAKEVFKRMQNLFDADDKDKKDFLNALRLKKVPQGATPSEKNVPLFIEEIIGYRNQFTTDPDATLIGTTGEKLFLLDRGLRDIETLFTKWKSQKNVDKDNLQWRLNECEKNLSRIKFEVEENKNQSPENKQLAEHWEKFLSYKKNDIEHLRKLFVKDPNTSNLKLISAFLDGNEDEIKKMQDEFKEVRKAEAEAEAETKKNEVVKIPTTGAADDHPDKHGDNHEGGHHDVNNIVTRFGKTFVDTMTVGGRVTWYSWYDISESFKLISESWKKHTESVSEDKRGPLAQKAMFWKKEVVRRIHHQDIAAERGRADELKKTYKNFNDNQLLAELKELPAKDRRRAILESLADRGNLRMSKRELIEIICPGKFDDDAWKKADNNIDYTPMREAFKESIDNSFIGEDNYGKELLEMHNAGFSKAEGSGKSYAGSNESTSTRAEVHNIGNQIRRALREGEGTVVGVLGELVDRANSFADNGQFANVEIRTGKGKKQIVRSADMGLVGLLITDAFIQGELSRELMMKIGKGNEQCFRPFATFQQVVGANEKKNLDGKNISHFEYWGWVDEKGITELGATQIINFFNVRNAKAQIKTPTGTTEKVIHMASDSNYKTHSGARITSIEQARKGIGDKFAGYVTKASGIEVFNQATKMRHDTGGATGEIREIASMIKAAVEDFVDGKRMVDNGQERYFDSFTKDEVDAKGYFLDDLGRQKLDKSPIPQRQIEHMGAMRAERGKDIIVRILKNMWLYREDREILSNQPTYTLYDYDDTDEGAARGNSTKITGTLKVFLEKTLGKNWGSTAEYREIMAAYDRLADPNKKLTRAEIDIAKTYKGEINSRKDLQKATHNSQTTTEEPY